MKRKKKEVASVPKGFAPAIAKTVRDRGNAYGSPGDNHQTTADLFSTWASRKFGRPIRFSAEDICVFNVIQKLSRAAFSSKDDTWLDIAGYTENVAMLPKSKRNKR